MNDVLSLASAAAAGTVLGAMFYGGLWRTVRRGLATRRAAPWFLASLLLRAGIALAGFYAVAGGQAPRLLACLLGFSLARFAIIRLTRPAAPPVHATEGGHAP